MNLEKDALSLDCSTITVTLVLIVALLYLIHLWQYYSGTPPGPWGIPIFGYLPFMSKIPQEDFIRLSKKYGDVLSVKFGTRYVTVINNQQHLMNEALLKFPEFDGRSREGVDSVVGNGISALVTDGNLFRRQRTFLLKAMRDFGSGKPQMENSIHTEAENTIANFKRLDGREQDVTEFIKMATSNVMSCLIFGKRFSDDDETMSVSLECITDLINNLDLYGVPNSFPNVIASLPSWLSGISKVKEILKNINDFVDKMIEEHERTFDENNLRDLIDCYLFNNREIQKNKQLQDNENIFSSDYMKANISNLFIAGVDSTAELICWALRIFAGHPDVQKKVQAEIDEVVGRESLPSMKDRPNMPYTEATILEIHRYVSLASLTMYRRVTEETTFNKYRIPKNSYIIFNLWSLNRSSMIWKNPATFDPQRFIDRNGKLAQCTEDMMPFIKGKRSCLGEIIARMELFLFITAFVQNFTFTLPKGEVWKFKPDMYVPMVKCHKSIVSATPRI